MIGDLISAGANIIGGLMGSKSADKARAQQEAQFQQNVQLQKDFAQNGIQWKVADAKAAGIHPIFALGGNTASYAPTSSNFTADMSMPNALSRAGQDIGRAVNATQNQATRVDAFTQAAQALQLESLKLDNDVKRQELVSRNARMQQQINPPMPVNQRYLIPGQAQTALGDLVKDKPMERAPGAPGQLHAEGGAITDTGYAKTSGGHFPVPSADVKERIEDDWYQQAAHSLRNNWLPMFSPYFNDPPKGVPLKEGHAWVYDPIYGYKQVPDKWYRKFIRN